MQGDFSVKTKQFEEGSVNNLNENRQSITKV